MLLSLVLFAVTTYLMGLAVVQLSTGRYRVDLETHVMCTGVGLAVFAVTTVLLNTFHIALTWLSLLLAACGYFVLAALRDILAKNVPKDVQRAKPLWAKDTAFLIAATGLAVLVFAVFLHGAFYSPWLTDEDSWFHAVSAKYVACNYTYSVPIDFRHDVSSYLEPYPPGYPVLMGVLHDPVGSPSAWSLSRCPSIYRTLKFFNVLIVSLGVVYFFIWVKHWTGRPALGLWITGVVCILPCFMSHFIWAQTMSLVMFFPAFWALERSRTEPRWNIVAAVMVAGMFLTQPSSPVVFMLMAGIVIVVNWVFALRKTPDGFTVRGTVYQGLACAVGALFSLVYYVPTLLKFGYVEFVRGITRVSPEKIGLKVSGVGRGRGYGLWDFIWAPMSTKINQPTGVGLVLFFVACAGLVLWIVRWKETKHSPLRITVLGWLVLTVIGLEAEALHLPVSLFPHRFWVYFAVPAAVMAGWLFWWFTSQLKGKHVLLAVLLGATLGATLALSGLGEVLQRGERLLAGDAVMVAKIASIQMGTWRTAAAVITGVISFALLGAWLYTLIQDAAGAKAWRRLSGVVLLVVGIALTSGYPKTWFEGFDFWDAGRTFYKRMVPGLDGSPTLIENDLFAYVVLRQRMSPNTPVLGLTCRDERMIGFDMAAPPLDRTVRGFRRELATIPLEKMNEDLVAAIHSLAVGQRYHFVTVDHHWASFPMLQMIWAQRRIRELGQRCGMDRERMDQVLEGKLAPTPREEPFLKDIREQKELEKKAFMDQDQTIARIRRLAELLDKSPLFEKIQYSTKHDLETYGAMLFKVNPPPKEETQP